MGDDTREHGKESSNDLPSAAFAQLLETIQRLRGPKGCAWDRAQTPTSLRASLVEEVWEAVSAIEARDEKNLEEELGDLYLLVTMIAWMKEQEGTFSVSSVLQRIHEKLIRRHPHVFGNAAGNSVKEILVRWDEIKAAEKGGQASSGSTLDHLPRALQPLEKSLVLQKKAAKVGFDWPEPAPVWDKIAEEMNELSSAVARGNPAEIEEEVGDLLFSVVNLSRFFKVDPTIALHATNVKFERRFREVEKRLAAHGLKPSDAGLSRMDALWNQIKSEEAATGDPQNASK
ncbi:MAG TPA: nucleoside triphosphate pyrophosphohydrolase [Spirochaetia bacterium]|nr:nucleoside triphosphate pyrophosphohydrolase [Spirochaetia bacterium]